jgi:hypothetical protein
LNILTHIATWAGPSRRPKSPAQVAGDLEKQKDLLTIIYALTTVKA